MPTITGSHFSETFPLAIVISRFNQDITDALYTGAQQRLTRLGFNEHQVTNVWVPGAIEIPIAVQRLAQLDKFEVIIAFGAVIRGETAHFEYVCQQVSHGCQQVALNQDVPVIFGVLTTETHQQALARVGGDQGHIGIEAVNAAIEMVALLRQIE